MQQYLVFEDDYVRLYNCDCKLFYSTSERVDLVFADPPFGLDLTEFEPTLFERCDGHVFVMTNERILFPLSAKHIDSFVRAYAINTVVPNLISNKAPMQLADFVSEFRFGKTRFINNNECFSNLIEAKKLRMMKQYSNNFDKSQQLFAFFFNHFTKEGDTILDPFCGSGSSIFAAKKLKRKIIAFEIDSKCCNSIVSRLAQKDLFI